MPQEESGTAIVLPPTSWSPLICNRYGDCHRCIEPELLSLYPQLWFNKMKLGHMDTRTQRPATQWNIIFPAAYCHLISQKACHKHTSWQETSRSALSHGTPALPIVRSSLCKPTSGLRNYKWSTAYNLTHRNSLPLLALTTDLGIKLCQPFAKLPAV